MSKPITPESIRHLREATGAGILDCKKALEEAHGDAEKASEILRKKGIVKAAKKASRVASEGVIIALTEKHKGVVLELNSETDFVAKNPEFQALAKEIGNHALHHPKAIEALKQDIIHGKSIEETITTAVAKIGENLNLRRVKNISTKHGAVISYIHNSLGENLGKIGVLVAFESDKEIASGHIDEVKKVGRQIAMHIAASKPISLNKEDVDETIINKEKEIFKDQAKASGKPDNIIEKMVEGRIRKFFEEVVLLEQIFVIDNKSKVSEIVKKLSHDIKQELHIKDYACFVLGEGIEKEEVDFAKEVMATMKSA
jgi:elongation factor Ts